ncbi:hypothetical protein BZA77DRAFT_356328 [Pyronema omphalodes]|nr:hypothetical protein BZA77DRAFT_356328 [Pyronema omphalodes]
MSRERCDTRRPKHCPCWDQRMEDCGGEGYTEEEDESEGDDIYGSNRQPPPQRRLGQKTSRAEAQRPDCAWEWESWTYDTTDKKAGEGERGEEKRGRAGPGVSKGKESGDTSGGVERGQESGGRGSPADV